MRFFRKKPDPIAESERQLNARLEALQGELRQLNERLSAPPTTSRPGSPTAHSASLAGRIPAGAREPRFEAIDHLGVQGAADRDSTPDHFNQLGVRKYDPMTTLRKWLSQIRGAPTSNPKLVNYLAAGSIHGLRPLRYEKRVARNRFLALLAFFVAILWGLIYIYMKNR
ncbi:MAG TPA: hypothetical protein PK640_03270 [Verrucomicrobiota bacterium]|mgnify:FL=1|nr:hypothetical protein [Verrucomicrobiota bacterium]